VYVSYYLFGWLLHYDYSKFKKYISKLVLIVIISLSLIFCGVQFVNTKIPPYKIFYANGGILVFVYSIAFFIVLYNIFEKIKLKISDKLKENIANLSKLTLPVFLIHISLLRFWQDIFQSSDFNTIIKILLTYTLTIVFSFVISFLLSKVKFVNELIKIK
jgi:hypothetical protein